MSQTYRREGHSVTIERDGSIVVNHGDSISKYSMAIHGDFGHLDEFYRKENGELKRITDINRIFIGETIYHVPRVFVDFYEATTARLPNLELDKSDDAEYFTTLDLSR